MFWKGRFETWKWRGRTLGLEILYDTRERNNIPSFLTEEGIEIKKEMLPVGDYLIGNICVEYKSIQDYIQSLHSGHLHKQLYQMSYNFGLSYLMIGGLYGYEEKNIKKSSFISSICGSSFKRANDGKMGQVITVQFEQEYDCALFLKYLKNKVEQGDDIRTPTMERHKYSKADWQLNVLCGLPNIGPKLGKVLLKNFGNIRAITNAEVTELVTVPGISETKAVDIFNFFNKHYASDWNDTK